MLYIADNENKKSKFHQVNANENVYQAIQNAANQMLEVSNTSKKCKTI